MALVYFDPSALVKLVVQEEGSDLTADLWDSCDAALASRLPYPEVRAALAAGRNHDLSHSDLATAEHAWAQYWAAIRPVQLTAAVERHAGQLARSRALRGADAVHLASALALADPGLIIAVWGLTAPRWRRQRRTKTRPGTPSRHMTRRHRHSRRPTPQPANASRQRTPVTPEPGSPKPPDPQRQRLSPASAPRNAHSCR